MYTKKQTAQAPVKQVQARQCKSNKGTALTQVQSLDMPDFQLYLKKKNKSDLSGYVYLKIQYRQSRAEKSMGVFVSEDSWDGPAESIIQDPLLTSQLQQSKLIYQQQLLGGLQLMRQNDPEAGFTDMIEVLNGRRKMHHLLVEEFLELITKMQKLKGIQYSVANLQKHSVCLRHVQAYLQNEYRLGDIRFEKIDRQFIEGFVMHLKAEAGNSHNSAMKVLQIFKKVYKMALDNNWIKSNAFTSYKISLKPVDREYLTQAELDRIKTSQLHTGRLETVRDMFVFSCYTGLAYSDLKNLSGKHLVEVMEQHWIKMPRTKTKVPANIPLLSPALKILERHNPGWKTMAGEETVFKVICNQKINAYLKEVAVVSKVEKNITFHMARHTFATTVTLANKVPLETVSKMLGHSKITMTQHYAKVHDHKIANDMNDLIDRMNEKG